MRVVVIIKRMQRYSRKISLRALRCILYWINGLFPFLWPMRNLFINFNYFRGISFFIRDYVRFYRLPEDPRFPLKSLDTNPCMFDRFDQSGGKPRHYFHQDWWAAKKVFAAKVSEHFDFGSRIDGFVAHCAVFCKVEVFDIRPLQPLNENIHFVQGDITNLKTVPSASIASLSSLHVFEHLGLGRYGDPLGPQMLDRAAAEVVRVLAPGANFYFSVPVGIQRLEFNAHRIFAVNTVLALFKSLALVEFSCIDDEDNLNLNANPHAYGDAEYSCGLFHFRKSNLNT